MKELKFFSEKCFPPEFTKINLLLFFFLIYLFIFIFGCVGSSFLREGFL